MLRDIFPGTVEYQHRTRIKNKGAGRNDLILFKQAHTQGHMLTGKSDSASHWNVIE